jgi:Holliday junction resolvasome RuvABC endonuclease subunit
VGQAGAEQVALVVHEDLGLVFEPAEGRAMDDAVAVALELAPRQRRRLGHRRPRELASLTA